MPGQIKTKQINHVTTMVKDTARAMKFYNELLGIKQIESQVPNPEITWLQLENGIMVHLIETPDAPVKPENTHHAFEVEDFELGERPALLREFPDAAQWIEMLAAVPEAGPQKSAIEE